MKTLAPKYKYVIKLTLFVFFIIGVSGKAQTFAKSMRATTDGDDNNGYCIAKDASNNLYLGGTFRVTVDFNPDAGVNNLSTGVASGDGNSNGFIGKYTSAGAYVWAFKIGNTTSGQATIVEGITVDGSGNVYVTGSFQGTVDFDPSASTANLTSNTSTLDIFIAKYDNSGNYQWAFGIGGGAFADRGYGIDVDASGNVYVVGVFSGTLDFNPSAATNNLTGVGGSDGFAASYTNAGAYRWAFGLGSTSTEEVFKVKVDDASANIAIAGKFQRTVDFDPSGTTNNLSTFNPASGVDVDGFVAKYTVAGAYVWAKRLGATSAITSSDELTTVYFDASDNVYVGGSFLSSSVDISGSSLTKIGSRDAVYAKFNSAGTLQWAKNFGTAANSVTVYDLYVEDTKLFLVGNFTSTIDFDPNAGTENGTSAGSLDIFFSEYNIADGSFVCKGTVGGTSIDYARAVVGDGSNQGSFYVIGWFRGVNIDFNPSTTLSENLTSGITGVSSDIFFGHYIINSAGAGCLIVLPIELTEFKAICKDTDVELTWVTAAEKNNDYFTIERSEDGIYWKVIGYVDGAGNSSSIANYSFVDSDVEQNKGFYYRLKQTDFNGRYNYSDLLYSICTPNKDFDFYVFPNPNQGQFTLNFNNEKKSPFTIKVVDVIGQVVLETSKPSTIIDLSDNVEGIYFVHIYIENNIYSKKILLQK